MDPSPANPPPEHPVVAARFVITMLGVLLILLAGGLSAVWLGFVSICTASAPMAACRDDVIMAASPISAVLPTALAAIIVSWLTHRAVFAWGWGLGLLATGVLIPVLLYLYPVS